MRCRIQSQHARSPTHQRFLHCGVQIRPTPPLQKHFHCATRCNKQMRVKRTSSSPHKPFIIRFHSQLRLVLRCTPILFESFARKGVITAPCSFSAQRTSDRSVSTGKAMLQVGVSLSHPLRLSFAANCHLATCDCRCAMVMTTTMMIMMYCWEFQQCILGDGTFPRDQ